MNVYSEPDFWGRRYIRLIPELEALLLKQDADYDDPFLEYQDYLEVLKVRTHCYKIVYINRLTGPVYQRSCYTDIWIQYAKIEIMNNLFDCGMLCLL